MADALKLSVVIATYGRDDVLAETLRRLAEQDLSPTKFEVVVADDGSPDRTPEVMAEAAKTVPYQLTYVRHTNTGIGYTQNRGLERARAPIVLLIADDIWLTRDALSSHLAAHEANPSESVAVLGRVEQSPDLTETVFLKTWDPFRFSQFAGVPEVPYYRFWACNISVKRDFIKRHGGFRETLGRAGAAAHEDSEVGYRLHKHGLRILYVPAALGFHHHVVTLQQACDRAYSRGLNFGEFYACAPEVEIPVAYRVSPIRHFTEHWRTFTSERRKHLQPEDRNPLMLIARQVGRAIVFNRLTVPNFWRPLFDRAETTPWLARLMHKQMYRGAINYYFYRGCIDADSKFDKPPVVSPVGALR
ncbi:MAG: glycosyltransferase [Hyphomicrobiaceae bacterium]